MRATTVSDRIGTILTLIVFGGFGVCFAGFGVYAILQSYAKQGWVAVLGGSVFICFGLGLAGLIIFACIAHFRDLNRAAADPDHPWRWSGQWNSSEISDHALGGAIGAWVIALIWNAIPVAGLLSILLGRQQVPSAAVLVVLVFLAIGIYLLVNGVRATARAMRYGKSTLHLTTMPGEIGGHLTGAIQTRRPINAIGPARLRLICKRTSSGEHSSTSIVWQHVTEIEQLPALDSGTQIPVDLEIPADVPATRPSSSMRDRIGWTLEATVAAGGVNYRSNFDVPVFDVRGVGTDNGTNFQPLPPPESNIAPAGPDQTPPVEPPHHPGIVLTRVAGRGCSIHFAAGRNWISTVIFTLLGAGFSEGAILAQRADGAWVVLLVLGLFAIIFDLVALNGWLSSATVTAKKSGLHIDRGWPLIRIRKDIPAASITDITDRVGLQAGNTSYYWLEAKADGGNEVTIARGIRDLSAARWVAAELLKSLGKVDVKRDLA